MGKYTARCDICLEKVFKSALVTFECCALIFCADCAHKSLHSKPVCPGCRADLITEKEFNSTLNQLVLNFKRNRNTTNANTVLAFVTKDNRRVCLFKKHYTRDTCDAIRFASKSKDSSDRLVKLQSSSSVKSNSSSPSLLLTSTT